jgi:hypothetical protein
VPVLVRASFGESENLRCRLRARFDRAQAAEAALRASDEQSAKRTAVALRKTQPELAHANRIAAREILTKLG